MTNFCFVYGREKAEDRVRSGTKAVLVQSFRVHVRKVLSGEWHSEETPSIPLEDRVVFWSRVYGEESVPDTRIIRPQLVQPITVEEIFSTLHNTKDGAVGLDKISRKDISKMNPRAL